MNQESKRFAEVRLIVVAVIDITKPTLADALRALDRQPSSLAQVVASEVVSNLESVSYIDSVIVSHL